MFVFLPLFIILGSHPGCSEAMRTRSLNPSMIEGVDALLVIGKEKCEDQLLLIRFFLSQPILSLNEDFMAHSKGWVVRCTGGSAGPICINPGRPLGLSSSLRKSSKENKLICDYTDREKVLYLLLYTICSGSHCEVCKILAATLRCQMPYFPFHSH
jgi:hypothetical protein